MRVSVLVVLIHRLAVGTGTKRTRARGGIQILEVGGFGHGLLRWYVDDCGLGKDLAEGFKGFGVVGPILLRELDGELDVHVTEIVVAVRRHSLSANHLDGVCSLTR